MLALVELTIGRLDSVSRPAPADVCNNGSAHVPSTGGHTPASSHQCIIKLHDPSMLHNAGGPGCHGRREGQPRRLLSGGGGGWRRRAALAAASRRVGCRTV